MKRIRISTVIAGLLALSLLVPACKKPGGGGGAGGGPSGKKVRVAFITNNPHSFWNFAEAGCRFAEKELNAQGNNVEVIFRKPPNGTASEQRRMIEDLKVLGVQAIAISPNNVDQQIDFFFAINDKIPLIMVDSDVSDNNPENLDARRCYLGTNNVEAGRAAGQLLKEAVPNGGDFVIFVGKLDVLNAVQRREGVVRQLAGGENPQGKLAQLGRNQYPITIGKHKLLDTRTDDASASKCREQVDDMLTKHQNLTAMVGLWAYNPPAMLEGVKKTGRLDKIKLVGFDEDEATLQGIEDGRIAGTIVQDPFAFGRLATHLMVALAKKDESFLSNAKYKLGDVEYSMDKNKRFYVPHRVIKKGDVAPFQKQLREHLSHLK